MRGEGDVDSLGNIYHGLLIVKVNRAIKRGVGDGAIHSAGIKLLKAQLARYFTRNGRFPGACRAVDSDDHA